MAGGHALPDDPSQNIGFGDEVACWHHEIDDGMRAGRAVEDRTIERSEFASATAKWCVVGERAEPKRKTLLRQGPPRVTGTASDSRFGR